MNDFISNEMLWDAIIEKCEQGKRMAEMNRLKDRLLDAIEEAVTVEDLRRAQAAVIEFRRGQDE